MDERCRRVSRDDDFKTGEIQKDPHGIRDGSVELKRVQVPKRRQERRSARAKKQKSIQKKKNSLAMRRVVQIRVCVFDPPFAPFP